MTRIYNPETGRYTDPFEGAPLGLQFQKVELRRVVTADGLQFINYWGGWEEATNYFSRRTLIGNGWTQVGDTTPKPDRFAGAPFGERYVRADDESLVVTPEGQHWVSWHDGDLWHQAFGNGTCDRTVIEKDWGWTHVGSPDEPAPTEETPEPAPEPSRVIVLHGGGDRWFYDAGKDRYYAIAPGNPNLPGILTGEDFREKVLSCGHRTYTTALSGTYNSTLSA